MAKNGYIGYVPPFSIYPPESFSAGITQHTLKYAPGSAGALTVVVGGVIQEPGEAYTVNGKVLTFASALPADGWVQYKALETGSDFSKVVEPLIQRINDLENRSSGATGGGDDRVFYENNKNVTVDYTLTAGTNAVTAGPITINDGVTVTIPDGSTWTVV